MSRKTAHREAGIVVDRVGALRTDRLLVTEQDAVRLRSALARAALEAAASGDAAQGEAVELLAAALRSAVVVPPASVPPDVATMRSRLVLKDVDSGHRRALALVYPEEERLHAGLVSVLSPLGTALLGLAPGALVAWPLPSGRTTVLRVESVEYQPEAAAEFHL